jgi:hypothetical protein
MDLAACGGASRPLGHLPEQRPSRHASFKTIRKAIKCLFTWAADQPWSSNIDRNRAVWGYRSVPQGMPAPVTEGSCRSA